MLFPVTDTISQEFLIGKVDNFFLKLLEFYFPLPAILLKNSKSWAKFRYRNGGFRKLTEESVNEWQKPLIFKSKTKKKRTGLKKR